MFEQTFKNIDDVLWKEAGCATELDYTEQTSWILFLRYLDDLERANEQRAELQGKKYQYIIDAKHRWSVWAAPKKKDGSFDHDKAKSGPDLIEYVDDKLFPYLKGFRTRAEGANTVEYKIGEIFSEIENKFRSGYFGEPVYTYSLKDGINDGFLTPFKVKQIATTLDDYVFTPDDKVVEGEIEEGKRYKEPQFNRTIEIAERERYRVKLFMDQIDQREKTLVFCATQAHAALVRDLINQMKKSGDPNYCVRVTAEEGERGDQWLRTFQDNEKTIPTILTTSQKLSTGVDARNVRNIVLMRPIGTMIEFKQIIGRGTRLFEGKNYFTIYDFVKAYEHFNDPEWDGEPIEPVAAAPRPMGPNGFNDKGKRTLRTATPCREAQAN